MFDCILSFWKSRCKFIHDKYEDSDNYIAANAISFAVRSNFIHVQSENWGANQLLLNSTWHPPPTGWIKINIDTALRRNHLAGMGGVIRDDKGRFLMAFGNKSLHWDISHLELMAVLDLKRLLKGWMMEAQGVIVEGDNLNIIKLLNNAVTEWKVSKNIDENLAFLLEFKQVVFSHSFRNGNKLADICANLALVRSFLWKIFMML
ncbi:uncharacterized protein LOC110098104 [Dendrobium catenatum]|uniref:uncharacterized protein LOC110098104 n=1 Tax=Dendrobium catenatum TaxID=906689 RepID=UPI0010A03272|nr:uncharacterized protein LOC110098104 [Dendrobium catenatum]